MLFFQYWKLKLIVTTMKIEKSLKYFENFYVCIYLHHLYTSKSIDTVHCATGTSWVCCVNGETAYIVVSTRLDPHTNSQHCVKLHSYLKLALRHRPLLDGIYKPWKVSFIVFTDICYSKPVTPGWSILNCQLHH